MSGSGDFSIEGLTVTGLGLVQGRFQGAARRLHDRLSALMNDEAGQIAQIARARLGELFQNPAAMQAAIAVGTAEDIGGSGALTEVVISASGLPYLGIHEYGGRTAPHDIFPTNAQVLHFFANSSAGFKGSRSFAAADEVFAKVVHHPGSQMPERSFMRYALAQRRAAIRAAFAEAGVASLND